MAKITTSIQPWITLENAVEAANFYKEAFGAKETYRMEAPDGGLVLKLSVDFADFWISGQTTGSQTAAVNLKPEVVRLILVVENPDAVFERAIKAGAKEIFPVGEDFGWRLGRLTDPFGLDWEIGKPVE